MMVASALLHFCSCCVLELTLSPPRDSHPLVLVRSTDSGAVGNITSDVP